MRLSKKDLLHFYLYVFSYIHACRSLQRTEESARSWRWDLQVAVSPTYVLGAKCWSSPLREKCYPPSSNIKKQTNNKQINKQGRYKSNHCNVTDCWQATRYLYHWKDFQGVDRHTTITQLSLNHSSIYQVSDTVLQSKVVEEAGIWIRSLNEYHHTHHHLHPLQERWRWLSVVKSACRGSEFSFQHPCLVLPLLISF